MFKLEQMIQERLDKVENAKLGEKAGENTSEAQTRGEWLIKGLEEEIADLRRRNAELERLSHTEDSLHFLQVCDTTGYSSLNHLLSHT